jgi:hypothetical protein
MDDYGVRILRIDGNKLDRPRYFEQTKLPKSRNVSAYHAVQKLGRASVGGREPRIERARKTVEGAYFGKRLITYELVSRKWNPYERFTTGKFIEEKVLRRFQSTGGNEP